MVSAKKNIRSRLAWLCVTILRGMALFVATYSFLSLSAYALGNTYNQNTWWIDLGFMPPILGVLLQTLLVASLYAFAVRIPRRFIARVLLALPSILFALFALQNMVVVNYTALGGRIVLGSPVSFSLFILLGFCLIAIGILFGAALVPRSRTSSRVMHVIVTVLTLCVIGVLFPLGQVLCFGTTEYRTHVDATVVFGAQVLPSGTPSPVLQDRLDKAIALYEEGRTDILIMSGGIDVEGVSEAQAMRSYAIAHGVPAQDILVDEYGNNTQDSVENTVEMVMREGYERVGAVSNFYHLARIKMLYLKEGLDVVTIPAGDDKGGTPHPFTFFREIPGWWYYWFLNLV